MWRAKQQTGFTIVELLIVVVVIAILAAVTIVAYNGITQRAADSVAMNNAAQAQKKIKYYAVENGDAYPPGIAALGLVSDGSIAYDYILGTTGYCLTSTSNGKSYYVAQDYTYTGNPSGTINQGTPASGVCPEAPPAPPTIANLKSNPSADITANVYGGPNSSVIARDTTRYYTNSDPASIRITLPVNSLGTIGVQFYTASIDGTTAVKPNSTYTISGYVYVPTGTVDPFLTIQGAGRANKVDPPGYTTALKDQWVRLNNTFTTNASGTISLYFLNRQATTVAGTQFWVDDVMITEGTTLYTYADGNSPGWTWTGTAGESTSSGPAL